MQLNLLRQQAQSHRMPQKEEKGGKRAPYPGKVISQIDIICSVSPAHSLNAASKRQIIKPNRIYKYPHPAKFEAQVGKIKAKYPLGV